MQVKQNGIMPYTTIIENGKMETFVFGKLNNAMDVCIVYRPAWTPDQHEVYKSN